MQMDNQGDTGAAAEGDAVNIRVDSPDARKLEQADLQVQEKRYSELQSKVVDFVRRNSLLKEAQHLWLHKRKIEIWIEGFYNKKL